MLDNSFSSIIECSSSSPLPTDYFIIQRRKPNPMKIIFQRRALYDITCGYEKVDVVQDYSS